MQASHRSILPKPDRALSAVEELFCHVWSISEVAMAFARFDDLGADPYLDSVLSAIEKNGLYPELEPQHLKVHESGWVTAPNPFQAKNKRPNDRIVAKLQRNKKSKRLLLVMHCYGIPWPGAMQRLFQLQDSSYDIAYNVMSHHQRGSFFLWPGSGLTRARVSAFIENMQVAITGVRVLAKSLQKMFSYEEISVIGYSIGGNLAMHLMNSEAIERGILYCPVVSLLTTSRELGLMKWLSAPLERAMRKALHRNDHDALAVCDPLRYSLRMKEENLHVIALNSDRMTPMKQIDAVKRAYPKASMHRFRGSHVVPIDHESICQTIQNVLHHG